MTLSEERASNWKKVRELLAEIHSLTEVSFIDKQGPDGPDLILGKINELIYDNLNE